MLKKLLHFLLLALCCGTALAQQPPAQPALSLLFIATGNVPAGKFRQLAEIARPHGLTVQVRYLHQLPRNADAGLWRGHDAVFIDSYLQDAVREHLSSALPALEVPHAWLYDQQPAWGGGLPESVGRRLVAYYTNGGRQNFEGFFALLAAQLRGQPEPALPAPIVFPKAAVYHPGAPGLVFAQAQDFLRWKGVPTGAAPGQRPPVIGIALHQQYIASMQTAFIDDLIARIEAGGAVALPFYTPMMDPTSFTRLLQPAGSGAPLADVLITTQIMLSGEDRRREFSALGIPVLQAMPYRRGGEADWAADPHGVALMDVPFYLAQPEYAGVTDIQVAAATRKSDDQVVPIAAQAQAVVAKALRLAQLQRKPNADKRVAVMFWNYPAGEKNLSASFLTCRAACAARSPACRPRATPPRCPTKPCSPACCSASWRPTTARACSSPCCRTAWLRACR